MTWKVSDLMDERVRFVLDLESGEWSMAQLCRAYDISRKTGYKWRDRYAGEGVAGLADRSRAHWDHPDCVAPQIEQAVIDARAAHPHWGPRKLYAWLNRKEVELPWPCSSTIGNILQRHGLTIPRKKRRRCTPNSQPLAACQQANQVWCADFKGWFRTQDGQPCYPLTITDGHTRYILRCQALYPHTNFEAVQPIFEAAFREFGLPDALRTDNGPPFATVGLEGLSELSVWWIRLGIRPDRIAPGKPQENGRHERMHKTLKAETATPPRRNRRAQQEAFDHFRDEFNNERPHEALHQQTPASHYHASFKPYPSRLPQDMLYPDDWLTRKVRGGGDIKWGGKDVYISQALSGERVGFKPIDDGVWELYFAQILLATFDERSLKLRKRSKPKKR